MRTAQYRRIEKEIAGHDSGAFLARWRYGRLLLVDDEKTTPAGHLRTGVLDKLIAVATRDGQKLDANEIQRRLRAGRAHPTEAQIASVRTQYETWYDLRLAGFPPVEAPDGARPYDPRETDELLRQHDRRGARLMPDAEQLAFDMFPKHDVEATLAELKRYAQEMRELTARFSARDDRRDEYLEELLEAVGGDETATLGEALVALAANENS